MTEKRICTVIQAAYATISVGVHEKGSWAFCPWRLKGEGKMEGLYTSPSDSPAPNRPSQLPLQTEALPIRLHILHIEIRFQQLSIAGVVEIHGKGVVIVAPTISLAIG